MRSLLLRSAIVSALGGFLFGFDTSVISGTESQLKDLFGLSEHLWGFTVSAALFGTILGAAGAAYPAQILGRRLTLMILGVLYFVSAIGTAFPWDWSSFLFFRFIGGLGVGGSSVVAPMYIAEVSPAKIRGKLVALAQFNVIFGITMAYISNYIILKLVAVEAWRWMLGIEAVPAALFFLLLFTTPESPRWLIAKGRKTEAAGILDRLGTDTGDTQEEVNVIEKSLAEDKNKPKERFFCRKYSFPIMLAIVIAAFNQLSGINAVLYYAPSIFESTGIDAGNALLNSAIIGITMTIFTFIAMFAIDRLGRKTLMLFGSLGYIFGLAVISWAYYHYGTNFTPGGGMIVLAALMVYIAAHAFGQGAVIWVLISEVFPNKVRAQGQSLGSFTHWFMAWVVAGLFPTMRATVGQGSIFAFFCFMMILQLLWVIFIMPETKQISLEEMEKHLGYGGESLHVTKNAVTASSSDDTDRSANPS